MDKLSASLQTVRLGSISLGSLLEAIVLLVICLLAIRLLMRLINHALARTKLDASLKNFIRSVARVLLWVVSALIVADALGIPTTSLVALVSVAGLALSLSVQDLLANLFSGITLLATRPFGVGDFIELGETSGTVDQVGLFYTALTTLDNRAVFIPNKDVAGSKILNHTRYPYRRISLLFSASYDSPTQSVREAILEAVGQDDRILSEPAPAVLLKEYGASSIVYEARVWVTPEDYWAVYYGLNEAVREAFARHGVEMTYDHVNVHIMQ